MRGVEYQGFGLILMGGEALDDDRAIDINRFAAEVTAWLSLINIFDFAARPGAVRQLVEKFAARAAGGGNAQHPEILIGRSGEMRIDGREVRRAVVIEHAALDHRLAVEVHHVTR